ncbi:DnaT-like ssDNA-binding domain-containing protein [Aestuariibacter sp. A3R04]|uniref:DnaT-like ssDNA-binding domain-containing protein n=1 Tax=Aestuariibacter sp. A3R04 TaxID=2841571 RepID=UPI001C082F95|nr:DnaT-like ssDNA-binding domain-containing protein [Aestuariibacter sp. A3R04]MBU3020218.1 flavodoxin [Aestuariibacter sp. A3R04]
MFTEAEYHALTASISNDCRVLYCLGLRPTADGTSGITEPLNYKFLITLLNGNHEGEEKFTRGQQINTVLSELEQQGLIALQGNTRLSESLSGQRLLLPLYCQNQNDYTHLHRQHAAIHGRWRPDPALFNDMADLLGLIDRQITDEDIGEFVAYWLGRPDAIFSYFQWTQKFAYAMKRKRTATVSYTATKKTGTQKVPIAPGIEADDNARKLVEKYAAKKKS